MASPEFTSAQLQTLILLLLEHGPATEPQIVAFLSGCRIALMLARTVPPPPSSEDA